MFEREDTSLRRWRRSVKKIGLLAVLAGLAPALSADSHSPAAPAAVSAESALSALSDGFLYSDYLQNLPNLQTETTPVVSGFHGSFAVENRPSLLESIADNLPARIRQEAQSVPLRQWGLGWAIDSRRPEVTPALAAGGWRLANWLGKEVLLSATDKYGIQTLEFDLQSELGGRRAAIGVNALGALRQTERNAIAWQLSGFKSKDGVGGNVGGLYRWVTPDENHLLGANLFLDYEDYEAGAFNRWSLGGEWRSAWVDAFANVYRGITDSKLHKGERYYTADGYELEVNVHSPNVAWIAGALTYYNWKGEDGDSDEDGVRFGLKFTPTLPLLLEVEYDDGDDRDNDWGGRIVYSGEFGGAQSPSVHRRGGEFVPRDFFFIAANRESAQRIRKVEDSRPSPLSGRVINLADRGADTAKSADIVITGTDITLTLDAIPNGIPTHYVKGGLEFGVSVAASVTVSLAAKYTVQSAAEVVTIRSDRPFAVETGAGTQIRTLFVGSTIALAENYAHLISGQITLAKGGGSYEIRRNIPASNIVAATYDSFIMPASASIAVISPAPNNGQNAPTNIDDWTGVQVRRVSNGVAADPIVLANQLFTARINGNPVRARTGGDKAYTLGIYGAPGQAAVLTVSPMVLRGYRITATLAGNQVEFDSGEDLTLTVNIPSSGNAEGVAPHILRIERVSGSNALPVPEHVNTVRFAYERIDNLQIALHDPQSGTGDPLRFVTLGAAAVASVSVGGGHESTRGRRIVSGGGVFSLDADDILRINAPAHGTYTVSVEVFDAFPDASLSPPLTAGLEVLFTTILAPVRGSWLFDGRELGAHATVTIHRTANPPAITAGAIVPRGGNNAYKTHELRGTDAALVEFNGNNLVIKDSTNPAAGNGNEIDFEVVIDDTSDPALPIATLAVPTTLTLKLFYVQVNALAAAVETPSGVSGTVLAAAAVPGAATPAASVNVSGGDGNATVRLAAGGDASFAVDSANRIVWTPRAFGKATATLAVRDGLTGLPGGTDEQNPVVVAELIRPASLAFDGGHLTADSGLASLTVTAFFGEEIPLAMRSFATLNFANGNGEMGFTGISGDRFVEPANGNNVFVINKATRAEATPKTATMFIRYRQIPGGGGAPVIEPSGHRYAVRLEAAYRPITLKAYTPDGSAEITAPVQVLTNNATVAAIVATGGRAGRTLEVLAGDFELIGDNKTTLRLTATDKAFRTYIVTLQYRDNSGGDERVTLTVNYADQTPPLALSFAGGIGNGGNVVLHRTAAGSVRIATLNIGGGLPPFVVGEKSASSDYDLANAPNTSRSRILYIPAGVEPTTGQGKSFAAEITVNDSDNDIEPQSITVNVRYVKVNNLASSLTDEDGNAGSPLGSVYVFSESELSALRTKLTEMKTTGGSAIRREFLVLEAHKDGTESITDTDRDRNYDIDHTANAANADLYFTPKDGYGTYSVVFKMRDSSVFGDGMIARAGFSPPTKQTLTVHARPVIVSVFAGHRPDRSNHASTVGLTHLPLQNTVIQLTVTARHDLVLTRALAAGNINDITVAQIHAPPGIRYYGFATNGHLMRLSLPSDEQPPAEQGRIDIIRLGPTSTSAGDISPTGQTFTLIMTAHAGVNNQAPQVATVRMEVKFESALGLDFVAPDSTDGTGDPKTLWRGVRFHPTTPVVVASAVLGGGTNPALSALPSDSDFKLLADNKIGLLPDRFGTYSLTVRATEDGGLTAETALTITVQPLYDVYVGDQKIEDTPLLRFTVSVAAEPITSPVRVAQFRFLGEGAANHCAGFSSGNSHLLALQKEGAICHMVVVPQSPAVTPDNRVLNSYINVGSGHLHPGLNRLLLDRNIEVQLAPKSGIRLTDPAAPASDPRTVFVDTEIKSNDNLEIAKVVAVAESGSPQIALINTDTNNPFSIDNANLLRLSPTRFGAHTATVRATDSANNSTADAIVTVSVHRAFRVFPGGGDTELTYQAAESNDYRFSVSITFDQTVVANLTLAELRGFNADVCARSTSPLFSNSASKAPGGVDIVKNGASCHLVLKPSPSGQDPTLPDNRDLVFDWTFSNPGSGYRFLSAGGVGARIFVKLAPKPDIKLSDPDLGGGDGIPRLHYAIGRFNRAVDQSPGGIVEPRSRLRIARLRAGPGAGSIYDPITNSPFSFDVDDDSRLLLTPGTSRFSAGPGTHIVTVAIGTSIGRATRTITVQLDRLYQIYDTDGDVLPDDLYQITLAIPFADEISANRDVAEFRLSGTNAALHCAGATAENADTSAAKDNIEFEFMKNAANCKLVFRPGSGKPNIRAAGQTLTVNVDFPDQERYYGTANPAYRIILDAMYEPIQLALGGANGSGLPITVVTSRDAEFARVGATGGDGTYTFEKIGDSDKITVAADGDLHFNVAANAYGEQTITVKVTDGAGEVDPATLIITANYIDRPYTMTDYRGNDIAPVIVNDIHEIRVSVYGPDRPTWDAGAVDFAFVTLRLASGASKGAEFCGTAPPADCEINIEYLEALPSEGKLERWQPTGSAKLEPAPGHEEGIQFIVNSGGSAVVTVWIRGYFIRTTDLALAVEKPESSASGPVRWFTEFASPPVASLVASLDATGGGEGTRAVITAAPPGDIFDLTDENILRFAPTAKGIYTLTLAAMDNVGTTPANQTVTVAYGDPLVAQMNSGGHDDSVQNGTLSNGGTVIFHNYFAGGARTGSTDLPIATLVAKGGIGARTFTWQDTSTGNPGNRNGFVEMSNNILLLNRFHTDSNGTSPSQGDGKAFDADPQFAATITVDDGFDGSPPVLLSITGIVWRHRNDNSENPVMQLEAGDNVFALHTDTAETPILTLGLPSTLAIGSSGLAIATVRTSGGYVSKNLRRVGGSSSSDVDVANPSIDGDDELREVILQNRSGEDNLADFPADANGESNTRSVVITYKTRYLGTDFFDGRVERNEATVSLKFKIKKMTATRESKDLIAAANAKIPDNIASGNLIREASDNTGNIDIARTDNTLTYAGLTVAKITFANLIGLGGKLSVSDLINGTGIIGHDNSILTITAGSTDNEIFLKTRVPAAHAASHPFTPALGIGGSDVAALDGGFVVNVQRVVPPADPFRINVYLSNSSLVTGPLEFLKTSNQQPVPFRRVLGAGGTGRNVKIKVAPVTRDLTTDSNAFVFTPDFLLSGPLNKDRLRITFDVNDEPDPTWPDGVDFTPERRIGLNFVGKDSNAELSCGSGGTRGNNIQIYTGGTGEVGSGAFGNRLDLSRGLTNQGVAAFARPENIFLSHVASSAGGGHRYSRCRVSDGSRENILCNASFPDGSKGGTGNSLPLRGGDVVLAAPSRNSGFNAIHGGIRHDGGGNGKFSNVLNLIAQRNQNSAAERNINLFRVYHKPGVLKSVTSGSSSHLELFLAKGVEHGQTGDHAPGCQTEDLPDGGNRFYLTSEAVRTYKVSEAAPESSFADRLERYDNRPVDRNPDNLACNLGGNQGQTQRFFEPGSTDAVGRDSSNNVARLTLSKGLTGEVRQSFRRQSNVYVSHAGIEEGVDGRRYSSCTISPPDGALRFDFRCTALNAKPPLGTNTPENGDQRWIHIVGGDVVLLAPFSDIGSVATRRHASRPGRSGQFESVLGYLQFARSHSADAIRHSNLFRIYHKPGEGKPGKPTDLELFAARGEYGSDRDAGCHTRDLNTNGSEGFYLTDKFVRTYKWQEAVHQSILDQKSVITTVNTGREQLPVSAAPGP